MTLKSKPYQAALKLMKERWPADQTQLAEELHEFCPQLAEVVVTHGIGKIWAQDTTHLSVRERELAVFAALIALPQPQAARAHAYNCLMAGVTEEQLKEVLVLLTLYLGVPTVLQALAPVQQAIAEFKKQTKNKKD